MSVTVMPDDNVPSYLLDTDEAGRTVMARNDEGSRWVVPEALHDPIRQDAVLLEPGAESEAARAFMEFLDGPEAAAIITRFGYGVAASS